MFPSSVRGKGDYLLESKVGAEQVEQGEAEWEQKGTGLGHREGRWQVLCRPGICRVCDRRNLGVWLEKDWMLGPGCGSWVLAGEEGET